VNRDKQMMQAVRDRKATNSVELRALFPQYDVDKSYACRLIRAVKGGK
jgi:hypothetical protein